MPRATTPTATALLALVLAAGTTVPAPAANYLYRARPVAIAAPAPSLPAGAVQSGPDVLLPPPVTADSSRPAVAGATYRTTRPMAVIGAEIIADRPTNILSVNGRTYYVCYIPTRSLPACLRDVVVNADPAVTAYERDGYLYYSSPAGFAFTPASAEERAFLVRFDFRQVVPG
ncbi:MULTISPECIES: hypothetical protein [Aureimonas]|uniref:Uncharacterized protein n=1 Tax=Aureimonas pseudogalii TaxID=1744844 RepID=A0A7W6H6X8_9HYPH|nr:MULTISPECIES: hypothetical protein [Aureimonas]MBB3999693.1 hypothetical protein [Aureimonas pseudogalii]